MNISQIKFNKKGVTLIELVVVVGLFVLIMGAIIMFVRPMRGMFAMNTSLTAYKEESKVVFELLEKRLRTSKYVALYDYIPGQELPNEPVGKVKSYIYLKDGILWYQKDGSYAVQPFIDPAIFDGNQLFVSVSVPDLIIDPSAKPNKNTLLIDLQIINSTKGVVYSASTGFELVNMVLDEARLYDLRDAIYDYDPLIVFLEEGEES